VSVAGGNAAERAAAGDGAVGSGRALMRLSHAYEDRQVELSLWVVLSYTGEPASLDGQRLKWVLPQSLADEDILEADRPFVEALARLPPP